MTEGINSLVVLTAARRMLAEAKTLDDLRQIRDLAEAARAYARVAKLGLESQNEAAEIKLRAERRSGELLAQMEKNKGTQGQLAGRDSSGSIIVIPPENLMPALDDIGITKLQSSRWQQMATLPQDAFEGHIADTIAKGNELTTMGMLRFAHQSIAKGNIPILDTSQKYRIIYADPPWSYGNMLPPAHYSDQADYYPTMSLESICAMPVAEIAEDNSVLFLWTTSPMLEDAFQVIDAWGFGYKTSFIWDKIKHGMGHYNSVRHEFLLVCIQGSCPPDVPKLFDSVVSIERTEHSQKPDYFREVIDTLYPTGKRIELFARKKTEGWDSWGNAIP